VSKIARRNIRVLIVDDEEIIRESLAAWLSKDGYAVESVRDGREALAALEREDWSILLIDLKMPGMDGLTLLEHAKPLQPHATFVMMTAFATVDTAVSAMKLGAYDYLVKPFDPEELTMLLGKIVAQQNLVRENVILRRVLKREYRFRDLVSKSPAMQAVFELAKVVAKSPSTVLILGESGTGKEVLARAIHAESPRAARPFVAVSCAALTETLLESELFGYERGAFTGANTRREGKFAQADGGTLFLDEIGDVGPKLQLDLLRVLEERRVTRLGGADSFPVDVRIIAATNRDLERAVADGSFRQDLFYRLNVIRVQLPPLREREHDIPLLCERFLERLRVEMRKDIDGVTPEAMALLMAHRWPGNVRELRNVIERGFVVARGREIEAHELGLSQGTGGGAESERPASLAEVERKHIALVLERTEGNVTKAARILDIDRVTLYNKIRKYGLRDS
jgi:DNA-binding NtrC family response regulator